MHHPAVDSARDGERCCSRIPFDGDASTVDVFVISDDDASLAAGLADRSTEIKFLPVTDSLTHCGYLRTSILPREAGSLREPPSLLAAALEKLDPESVAEWTRSIVVVSDHVRVGDQLDKRLVSAGR